MADISKCANPTGCPLAGNCYRNTATPSTWQSYMVYRWMLSPTGPQCDGYWPNGYTRFTTGTTTEPPR